MSMNHDIWYPNNWTFRITWLTWNLRRCVSNSIRDWLCVTASCHDSWAHRFILVSTPDASLEGWLSLPGKNTKRFGWDKKVKTNKGTKKRNHFIVSLTLPARTSSVLGSMWWWAARRSFSTTRRKTAIRPNPSWYWTSSEFFIFFFTQCDENMKRALNMNSFLLSSLSKLFHVRPVTQTDVYRADVREIPRIFQVLCDIEVT